MHTVSGGAVKNGEEKLCKHVKGYLANSYIAHYAHYGN